MKRSDILRIVGLAIATRENKGPHNYYIWLNANDIVCTPCYATAPPELLFGKFTNFQLVNGLSSTQWSVLESRIAKVLHQKGLL